VEASKAFDIRERAFAFAVRVVKFCHFLGKQSDVNKTLSRQLLRSATTIGANLEEA
jgi:four helix bundle protein